MATIVTCEGVTIGKSGRVYVTFEDGAQLEFGSLADVQAAARDIDSDVQLTRMLLIAWWLARSPGGSNESLIKGKTLTFELSGPSPIRIN